jgi:hypothetical protein
MKEIKQAFSWYYNKRHKAKVIKGKLLEMERNRGFELGRSDRFRYRTRYFTDSGIIGSKEFVAEKLPAL